MNHDVYNYTDTAGRVSQNTVLRKTYGLLGLSFVPAAIGAVASTLMGFNVFATFGSPWIALAVFFAFVYGMCFLIEKNRYSNTGVALLMVFTFGMGILISPLLQRTLGYSNGGELIGIAAAMTAGVFFTMAALARRANVNTNGLGRFLTVGAVVLIIGMVASWFLQIPALTLTVSAGFAIFSSLMIMWQVRTIIEGGENSHISATLTIFISIYNIFSSLLNILGVFSGED
ncbi:Bax inhibitor-1/YccA family protein [Neisseria wadsworthii]|uniref:Inner membrane protein YccA n=1 Tax=Neisseria wadsworthii 9715 TaxID=1030841 RepID=G4CSR2_9NEIS|nr:Bax inhibitor-1/YccA family protein [Neisseria wadsworthii]EGZ44618.1 inner membrane protein YccA [Neisseria wadsworthii 9715]QMT35757.1 Bax inhibitor-1/YccA family protein [Neisseria wadsworthii]